MTPHVLSLSEFKINVEPIVDDLFKYRQSRLQPFAQIDWFAVAVPQVFTNFDEKTTRATMESISNVDGGSVYVVAIEGLDGDMTDMAAEISKEKLAAFDFEGGGFIRLFDYAVFDASRRWAIVSFVDDFTLIGGDATFMTAFAARVEGGMDAIKRRFIEYVRHWHPSVQFRKKVLAAVGWQDAWHPKE